ncbi:MAG: hypothetical protein HN404_04330 [Gemmatimonadetes bacterium]|jgi:hypothetical protein|nr:hypothetical protein [Gemmatimonadota bacterium]
MDVTGTIEQRKGRWQRFLDQDAPPQHMLLVRHDAGLPSRPLPHPDNIEDRVEWAWGKYQKQIEAVGWLNDDTIPHLDPYTGTEIFAAAFGCSVHRPDDSNPFALPRIHDASEVAGLDVPQITAESLAQVFGIADELRRRAGPEAVMRLPDIQSPMDIAALIWEKSSYFVAMIESPDAVRELAAKVRQLMTGFLDEWFARYGTDFVAHYPDYYMPAGITLSEDEIGAVNGDMFAELFLPELVELSQRYGGLGMHCCADARHHWEGWGQIPDLRLLNVAHKPHVVEEAYDFFADRVPQMHSWCGDGDPANWQYPEGSRVVISAPADSAEDARRLADEIGSGPR